MQQKMKVISSLYQRYNRVDKKSSAWRTESSSRGLKHCRKNFLSQCHAKSSRTLLVNEPRANLENSINSEDKSVFTWILAPRRFYDVDKYFLLFSFHRRASKCHFQFERKWIDVDVSAKLNLMFASKLQPWARRGRRRKSEVNKNISAFYWKFN